MEQEQAYLHALTLGAGTSRRLELDLLTEKGTIAVTYARR